MPRQFTRDRPSTALITRKELEEILAAKMKEEMLDKKTMPPKSGTISTDLWTAEAEKQPISEEFSVASGESVDEDDPSPFGRSPKQVEVGDEYDINFFDMNEMTEIEEVTEHTEISVENDDSANNSFDMNELGLTESMEQRYTTIRFDEYDELQTCLHINDYTRGEITRSWYKRDDYDKMVDLARKTASKAVKREKELREEVEAMLRVSVSPPRSGRKNGEAPNPANDGNLSGDNKSVDSGVRSADGKKKKPIEYRGLEAWTPEGSAKCRSLKENAIELVWNEQSRQWEDGTFDPDAISEVYIPVSRTALAAARERAIADEKMVRKLNAQEAARAEKKRNRGVMKQATHAVKKKTANAGKGLVQGAGKVLTETGKGAMKIGKRAGRAGLATATLDPKMMKEALKVRAHGKKKRECKTQNITATSKAAHERDVEILEESGSLSLSQESPGKCRVERRFEVVSEVSVSLWWSHCSNISVGFFVSQYLYDATGVIFSNAVQQLGGRPGLQRPGLHQPILQTTYEFSTNGSDKASVSDDLSWRDQSARETESNLSTASPQKKKKSKLKLLGVVPIPGTERKYSEDRRAEREQKRLDKMTRRPSWEASMTTGKY